MLSVVYLGDGLLFGVGGDEFVYLDLGQIMEDTEPQPKEFGFV